MTAYYALRSLNAIKISQKITRLCLFIQCTTIMYTPGLHTSLDFNCGFARCAVREYTPKGSTQIDQSKRESDLRDLFTDCPNYGLTSSYFAPAEHGSLFNRHCEKIIATWSKKWHPKESRNDYERNFSVSKWKALPADDKQLHTLACCKQCQTYDLQLIFPGKPHYEQPPILALNHTELQRLGTKQGTRDVLREINQSFEQQSQKSFTDSLVKHGGTRLQIKPTPTQRKNKLRQIYRKCRKHH